MPLGAARVGTGFGVGFGAGLDAGSGAGVSAGVASAPVPGAAPETVPFVCAGDAASAAGADADTDANVGVGVCAGADGGTGVAVSSVAGDGVWPAIDIGFTEPFSIVPPAQDITITVNTAIKQNFNTADICFLMCILNVLLKFTICCSKNFLDIMGKYSHPLFIFLIPILFWPCLFALLYYK